MKVSIILPIYNVSEYLVDCLESIHAQTFTNYELIAINDGSTDGSYEVLLQMKDRFENIRIIDQENIGLGATRNVGLDISIGEYVLFLDSDDKVTPNMLEKVLECFELYGCDIVGFEADIIGDIDGRDVLQYIFSKKCDIINEPIKGMDFFVTYHKRIPLLNIPLLAFKRKFLIGNHIRFMEEVFYEDVEFYYRLVSLNPTLVIMDNILYHRRYRTGSIMTSEMSERKLYDNIKVFLRIASISANRQIAELYRYHALKAIRHSLEQINNLDNQEIIIAVKDFYSRIITEIDLINFLALSEYYLGAVCIPDFRDILSGIKKSLEKRFFEFCDKTGLGIGLQSVGIYGTGGITETFLKICEACIGGKPERVVYIDTYTETGKKLFHGSKVYNFKDVNYSQLSSVIVSSELYDKEITDTIRKIDNNIKVYSLLAEE